MEYNTLLAIDLLNRFEGALFRKENTNSGTEQDNAFGQALGLREAVHSIRCACPLGSDSWNDWGKIYQQMCGSINRHLAFERASTCFMF
jgi:hypothetical protein